ncbi:protein containing DUF820 [Candidatus Magnetomorum sp. HK-1]|nr:protein containing DUF820 [Candidatus Magnetomorum sp. HK-1]
MEALQQISVSENQFPIMPEFFHNLKTDIPILTPLIREDITPQSEDGLMVSEEEYWKNYYEHPDFNYEWNNGILEVKSVGDFASYVQSDWFISVIKENLKTNNIGTLVGLEIGFKLALPHKTSIRKPDLAVILKSNPVQIEPFDCTYKGCFDMCIEFVSDTEKKGLENDTIVKKIEYSQAGVKEYFILDRKKKETAFYRLNSQGKYKKIKPRNGVIESKVLPGFKFRVKDLYSQPPLEELINDEVYQPYVLKSFQEQLQKALAESQKAEAEHQRAETERLRAETERLRAEKERLRAETERLRADKAEKAIKAERQKAKTERQKAKAERQKAKAERQKAEAERQKAKAERQKAEVERQRAEKAESKAKKLAAKLKALLKEKNHD